MAAHCHRSAARIFRTTPLIAVLSLMLAGYGCKPEKKEEKESEPLGVSDAVDSTDLATPEVQTVGWAVGRILEVHVDRLALCVAGNDSHWLGHFADQTATVFRRRRVGMDDVVRLMLETYIEAER